MDVLCGFASRSEAFREAVVRFKESEKREGRRDAGNGRRDEKTYASDLAYHEHGRRIPMGVAVSWQTDRLRTERTFTANITKLNRLQPHQQRQQRPELPSSAPVIARWHK